MSETKYKDTTCTTRATKSSKPFCSLAYLAKSTIAVNNSNDVRIVNGIGNYQVNSPNVAATAKVNERCSPTLPTGANTNSSGVNGYKTTHNGSLVNGNASSKEETQSLTKTATPQSNGHKSTTDIFGVINEEQEPAIADEVDGAVDPSRPWQLSNGYCKRVPPSLMTTTHNGYNGYCSNGLTSLTKLNSLDCWDYTIELECLKGPQDLQLAAELGKTLLERNKELETLLKEHKSTIEEQEQEIVYLKKHTTALREVNDSRLKVYEQLEVGIQDLERANHRLLIENTSDKKHIKTLVHNVETLESRCDELTKILEEARQSLSMERRKVERLMEEKRNAGADNTNVIFKPKEINMQSTNVHDSSIDTVFEPNTSTLEQQCSFLFQSSSDTNSTSITENINDITALSLICGNGDENEEIIKIVNDLESTKKAFISEQQRCTELEEQLVAIIQENQTLQSRIAQTNSNEEMKSMHEELSILDEVRQGQMCSRCLRSVEDRLTVNDEQSSIAPTEEGEEHEERSLLELEDANCDENASEQSQVAYRPNVSIKISSRIPDSLDLDTPASPNPYRDLVEKYEALLEVQRSSIARKSSNGMSLVEEFQSSGEFNQTQKLMLQAAVAAAASTNGDAASSCNGSTTNDKSGSKSARGRTPTEFSEAETSSSGYSDETSNKCTQTDDRPGYFLCSIGDGEDCKFSIYDDASPIDSRFRNRPEYRELFKEIFAVLKKAAENKEEGDKLPLLDDTHPTATGAVAKVPPVTPANEELPVDFGDDTQSIISSAVSEQSFAMSECITKLERKTAKKHIIEKNQENKPPTVSTSISQLANAPSVKQIVENGRVLTPLKREPLEYLSVVVGVKKKSRKKNRNYGNDRSDSPIALPSPPRIFVASGRKRKDVRPFVESPIATTPEQSGTHSKHQRGSNTTRYEWNGSSMVIYNRNMNSPQCASLRGRELDMNGIEYRPSTVSQDLHKLKKLDLSYAEVLRRADACKHHHVQQRQRRHHH